MYGMYLTILGPVNSIKLTESTTRQGEMRHVVSSNIPRTQLCKDPVPIKSKDVDPSIQISKFKKMLWGKLVRFNKLRKKID